MKGYYMEEKTHLVIYGAGYAMAGDVCWLDCSDHYFMTLKNSKSYKKVWDPFYCKKLKITVEEVSDEEFEKNFVNAY